MKTNAPDIVVTQRTARYTHSTVSSNLGSCHREELFTYNTQVSHTLIVKSYDCSLLFLCRFHQGFVITRLTLHSSPTLTQNLLLLVCVCVALPTLIVNEGDLHGGGGDADGGE